MIAPNCSEIASEFLTALAGPSESYDWRAIHKNGSVIKQRGTLEEVSPWLKNANDKGAGVFVMVNATDGSGQTAANVNRVRAVFVDLDGAPLEPVLEAPLKPHLVIESSPGKWHAYWLVDEQFPLALFTPTQKVIAKKFNGDSQVCDLPRIMRLPGFFHQKGEPFQTRIADKNDSSPYTAKQIEAVFASDTTALADSPDSWMFDIKDALEDGQRTKALTHFCGKYISLGWSDPDILLTLRRWNLGNLPPLSDQKVVDTLASIRDCDERNHPVPQIIEEFNQSYAVAPMGGKTVVIWEHDSKIDFMTFNSFREYNSNLPRIEKTPSAQYWLTHSKRRTYAGITFDPSVSAANNKYFNLWKGFAVEPREGDCSKFLQHIEGNITNGDSVLNEYVLDWMADTVQNPSVLPGVSLVMCGPQGTGKGVFARYFGQLFGPHCKHVQTAEHLTGKFTQHLADAALIYADEVVWGGDKQREGILKTLITEPTRYLEAKGKDAVTVKNYARVLMSTNEVWAVPAGLEERRYCVMTVGDMHMQDSEYFAAIAREMESGGLEALLNFLLNRDISNRNIRNFPRTAALLSQKERTLGSVPKWWLNCLKMGSHHPLSEAWVTMIYTKDLFANYCEATVRERFTKGKADNPSDFISALKQYVPMVETRGKIGDSPSGRDAVEVSSRPRGYKIADLEECRAHFEKLIGHTIAWEACHA